MLSLLAVLALSAAPAPAEAAPFHPERPDLSLAGLTEPCGVATDSHGDLYVVQAEEIFVYSEPGEGASPTELTHFAPAANSGYPCSIAVDAGGDVYVGSLEFEGGEAIAQNLVKYKPKGGEFPPTAATEYEADTAVNGTGVLVSTGRYPNAVAVDPETQRVYVAEGATYEKQSLGFSGFAAGNKFTLTCDGETTGEIEYTTSAAIRSTRIKNALEAKCGAGNFTVTGSGTGTSTISFKGKYLGQNIPTSACAVISGSGTCTVTPVADGAPTHISSFQPNGSPVSETIGEGLVAGADYYGIGVDGESGDLYVTDRAHAKAYVLNPAGSAIETEIDGSEAPAGGFGAMEMPYLGVDQSSGDVLISDLAHGVVDEFSSAGTFVTEISHTPPFEGNGSVAPSIAVDNGSASPNQGSVYVSSADGHVYAFGPFHPERPDLSLAGLTEPCGVATDSHGDLYVVQAEEIFVYSEPGEGASPTELTHFAPAANSGYPCSIAVDAGGDVYVGSLEFEGGEAIAQNLVKYKPKGGEFPPTAATEYEADTAVNGTGVLVSTGRYPNAVAVDPETQRVYVAEGATYEKQSLGFSGFAAGNKFTLTCDGETTGEIEYTTSAAIRSTRIKNALEAKCGAGNFTVTGSGTGTSTISFKGKYLGQNIPTSACAVISGSGTCTVTPVADGAPTHISSFQPNGSPVSETIGEGLVAGADYYGIGVDGESGDLYVTDRAHAKAYVLNPAGSAIETEIDGSEAPAGGFGAMEMPYLGVDQSSGDVLISDLAHGVVDEFSSAGTFVTEISHTPPFEGNGSVAPSIAVDNGSASPNQGSVYVSSADGHVYAFGPLPGSKAEYPLTVTKTGGGSGTVTSAPAGISCGTTCEAEFAEGKQVVLTASPGLGSVIGAWSGCGEVTGTGGDECKVTVSEAREVGIRFDARPLVSEEAASQITSSSARLEAKVNPRGGTTTYRFEYITESAWQSNGESFSGATPATQAPETPLAIGDGSTPVSVGIKIEGLEPLTAYRFRAVAVNGVGTAAGERDGKTDVEIPRSFTTYSPPETFAGEACPNAGLRSGPSAQLPDCRAWEQASPVDKNGASIQGLTYTVRAAEDGDSISFESAAGIPGGEGAQNFPTYVAQRGTGSWSTTGLLPSAGSGQRARVLGWTPDFAEVFDQAEVLGTGNSLLARSTANGSQLGISPYTLPIPEYKYVGASKNGATVIFEAEPEESADTSLRLTSDAAPGKPNVYAWNREEPGELHLAGVLPDGSTPALGSSAVSEGQYAYDTNQVTENGSALFTDRETGQLYMRLNPTATETSQMDAEGNCEPDPVLACTVHVSASQKTNGGGSEHHDAAGPQPARFMASSPDGSTVTFLSSEKLTNDATTGPEPVPAAIARAKASDGGEKSLSFLPAFAQKIAIDEAEGYVYWTDPAHDRIGRAKLDGSDFTEDYISGLNEPQGIAVIDEAAAKFIFWTERGPLSEEGKPQADEGNVGRANLDGSNVQECVKELTNPRSIAVNSEHIFWTSPGTTAAEINEGKGSVGRASLNCDALSVLAGPERASGDIAVDASHIYTSSIVGGSESSFINAYTLGGSFTAELVLIKNTKVPAPLAVDSSHLYWANPTTSKISRSNLNGTSPEPEFITQAGHPESLAVNGGQLYWTANQQVVANAGTDLYQLDRESGELADLTVDGSDPNGAEVQGVLGIAEDGSFVYFAANGVLAANEGANHETASPGDCRGTGDAATGSCNLYVAHDGQVDFIARLQAGRASSELDSGDALDWIATHGEVNKNASEKTSRVSADGRVLVFRSSRKLSAFGNQGPTCGVNGLEKRVPGNCLEFYRFDYGTMGLGCVTCDPRGATPTGPARLASLEPPGVKTVPPASILGRNLSRSGSRFFFETPDALVARDTNGEGGCPRSGSGKQKASGIVACQDVYEWEAPVAAPTAKDSCTESSTAYSSQDGGCIYLISTGKSGQASFFGDADLEGENVFVFTYERLVGQDKDGLLDVYDARVDGGLAGQNQAEAPPCASEACKGQPAAPPPSQSPGSAAFAGPGNVHEASGKHPCPRGKVRKGGKCVKKPQKNKEHHKRSHKRANSNRGGAK